MNLQRCKNGHYYDMDLSQSCPHCAKQKLRAEPSPPQRKERIEVKKRFVTDREDRTVPIRAASDGSSIPPQSNPPQRSQAPAVRAGTRGNDSLADEEQRTQGIFSVGKPVAGWLVCTSGIYYGRSFPLFEGINTIGRGSAFSIPMTDDLSVSRTLHAVVIFDPKENQFLAAPGEANDLCYVNDAVVLTGTTMQKNDKLVLGKTELMLIPCCDSAFCWEKGGLSK